MTNRRSDPYPPYPDLWDTPHIPKSPDYREGIRGIHLSGCTPQPTHRRPEEINRPAGIHPRNSPPPVGITGDHTRSTGQEFLVNIVHYENKPDDCTDQMCGPLPTEGQEAGAAG